MNIRGTDSAALAAATDLFVAPASRDDGTGGFQRALQPPRPYEPSPPAVARQEANPPPRTKGPEAPNKDAEACEPDHCDIAAATSDTSETEVTEEQAAPVAEEVADAVAEIPAAEEPTDEQNVAAESIAAAAVVVTEQHLPDQQLPTITTEVTAGEHKTDDEASKCEIPTPIVSEQVAVEVPVAIKAVEQPVVQTAVAAAEPVVAVTTTEAFTEVAVEAVVAETTEPTAGIGVLPSAVAPQAANIAPRTAAPRTTAKAASTSQERASAGKSSAPTTHDQVSPETAPVVSSMEIGAAEASKTEDESDTSTKKDQPWFAVDNSPAAAIPQPVESSAALDLKIEPPTAPTEAPMVSDNQSAQQPAPDATKLPTTQPLNNASLTSRLPAQALVRGSPQPPAPLHVDAARFLQRVTKAFESARDRGGEIRLRLSPPELGALRVEVNMSEHGLAARVEVETNDARTVLLENLPALRERLAEQGLRLEKFDVELSQREPDQQGGNLSDQSRDRQSQPEARTVRNPVLRPNAVAATPTDITPSTGWQDRQLNVIV
jgi:flagellar hook-length control protein FliK